MIVIIHQKKGVMESVKKELIKRALEKVWSDTTKPIIMKEVIIAFLKEHKYTKFTFKCHSCHENKKK